MESLQDSGLLVITLPESSDSFYQSPGNPQYIIGFFLITPYRLSCFSNFAAESCSLNPPVLSCEYLLPKRFCINLQLKHLVIITCKITSEYNQISECCQYEISYFTFNSYEKLLTNSMTYGTRRLNAAFTRALQ